MANDIASSMCISANTVDVHFIRFAYVHFHDTYKKWNAILLSITLSSWLLKKSTKNSVEAENPMELMAKKVGGDWIE